MFASIRRTLKITPVMKFLVLRNRHRLNSVGLDLQLLYSTTANGKKPRVVIVGTGWGGSRLARDIDVNLVLLKVISARNHMLFTPLLPQTCCGSLEFRSICENILNIQPALRKFQHSYHHGMCYDVDAKNKILKFFTVDPHNPKELFYYSVPYDVAILAYGSEPLTFGIEGVEKYSFFLREIHEARGIRRKLIRNILMAQSPGLSEATRRRLLKVVVVGGGPTGVEFASDLCEFIKKDLKRIGHGLAEDFKIVLVEAGEVLGTFDRDLRQYASGNLQKIGVEIKRAAVEKVYQHEVVLSGGERLDYGLLVWSTGVGPTPLTLKLPFDKTKQKRIAVDDFLRVMIGGKPADGLYAIGDCAGTLPQLAAVAERQAKYLAEMLNRIMKEPRTTISRDGQNMVTVEGQPVYCSDVASPFKYRHLGSMVSIGGRKALVDLPYKRFNMKGFLAWLVWRSAYLTMIGSFRSRLYVMLNWSTSFLFGRDLTYIANATEAKALKDVHAGVLKGECAAEKSM